MLFLFSLFFTYSFFCQAIPLIAGLEGIQQKQWDQIQEWLKLPEGSRDLEVRYQRLVQKQVFLDLLKLYAPENGAQVKVTYASFTPDLYWKTENELAANFGEDAGLGLHVIKRLEVPLINGGHRTIEVNEHWAQDRQTGGLFLPDEIRVKTQVAQGERKRLGGAALYLFDSFRLAWGPEREIGILRRSRFASSEKTSLNRMRVPVSAPFSCLGCHREVDVSQHFANPFLAPGESRNFEAIVQDGYFKIPLRETRGFQQYLKDLKTRPNVSPQYIASVEKSLLAPEISMQVPGLMKALQSHLNSTQWMNEDRPWNRTYSSKTQALWQQGTYPFEGIVFLDVIEEFFEGKYRWWEPEIVVPLKNIDERI